MNNTYVHFLPARYFPYSGRVQNVQVIANTGKRYKIVTQSLADMSVEDRQQRFNTIKERLVNNISSSSERMMPLYQKRLSQLERLESRYGEDAYLHLYSSYVTFQRVALD